MADDGGLGPRSGKFSVLTGWMTFWFSLSFTFWSAELFSGAKGSQHLSIWQDLPPRAEERSRRSTECARLDWLDCSPWQAKFSYSLFEKKFEEPCLVLIFSFCLGILGGFAQKPGRKKAFQPLEAWALALGGRHQSASGKLSQRCPGRQYWVSLVIRRMYIFQQKLRSDS